MKRSLVFLFFSATLVSMAYAQHAMVDDKELMTKLMDAAPAYPLEHATILNMGADGKMKVSLLTKPFGHDIGVEGHGR